ncbi:membrane protein [Endozoicomonas montiporae]|uniref:Outer membrane protein assembly factor BamA n=2 Tax=Endozoicomonas montiporae TaxID=1027273 RepID=A0A081NBN3_9GAMM|nr:outer membrane protein assembly factor BamA [Endozoicomonas montiporae]AMO56150.1 surface antigen [Endozoicomonas montiporae CL-33]KEQ15856.1 membrane protein [Endozoicomonas montiporae]
MKRSLLSLLIGSMAYASGANAFVVSDIRIDGLQRVSAGTVFNSLPIEVGDDVLSPQIADAAKSLFRTGYFKDIQMGRDGDVLVVSVVERPSISQIKIEGNKAIKTDDLMNGLRSSGLSEGEIFQQATLEAIRLELERQYVSQGRYGASISANVEALPRNRVKLTINVKEGKVATIRHINVVGNTVFPQSEVLDLFELKETGMFSFFGSSDKYSREKLSGDLERLRSHYLDRGYINFNIRSTQVSISPDKQSVFITVNIDEGDKYTINEVKLAGDLIIDEEEARNLVLAKPDQTFSRRVITTTEEILSRRLGNEGYTFANVSGIPTPDHENKTVDLTFFVDPGRRAYVRRINFSGNTKTEDEVLRREMRQMEGASANTQNIEQSKVRLERLGFFRQVDVETPPVPGSSDQIDVNYTVEEQPSGSITASVGYSQSDGLLLGGSISQSNFLGTGNNVSVGLNKSDVSQLYNFSFTDPYYTVDGVSRGFGVYYRTYDYDDSDISSYAADTWGTDVRFGYPISETQSINFSAGVEGTKISTGNDTPQYIRDYIANEGNQFTNVKGTIGWSESELNRGLLPTRGYSQSASAQVTIPGSDVTFYKLNYRAQYFQPLTKNLTARFAGRLGYIGGYGSTNDIPFFEHYYGGGFASVRGYKDNTLGPKAKEFNGNNYNSIGGDVIFEGTAEILFPLPFVKDQRSLRTSLFLDFGNVYDTSCSNKKNSGSNLPDKEPLSSQPNIVDCYSPDLSQLRYSVGLGLTWITPLGPLTFSLAKALNADGEDETQVFQFSLGAPF